MTTAAALRLQIEAALAHRIPSALTPAPRLMRPVAPTGIASVDALLDGGLPLGAITEVVGPESSGRTSLALSFVAQMTQSGKVCAWVDVSDALDPESAAAIGVHLPSLLWVRCGPQVSTAASPDPPRDRFHLPDNCFVPAPAIKGLHGGGHGPHPRAEAKGLSSAVGGFLHPRHSPKGPETETSRDRNPQNRTRGTEEAFQNAEKPKTEGGGGFNPRVKRIESTGALAPDEPSTAHFVESRPFSAASFAPEGSSASISTRFPPLCSASSAPQEIPAPLPTSNRRKRNGSSQHLFSRIDQALRVADLLLQAGGFSAIVLDMAGIAPQHATRVPIATWFRYRAAAERTQAAILLLTQHPCAKSSAALLLELEASRALEDVPTLFTGLAHRLHVTRERFQPEQPQPARSNVLPIRKPPQSVRAAGWKSRTTWSTWAGSAGNP